MAPEGFKRKLTAIFSADVVGYSRLMGEDEAETVRTLTTCREIMTSLIKQHRGRVVDSPGDNILAEFVSVVDAVQCAVAVQKELQTRNAGLPDSRRMEFRIGINLGDVIDEEERIYGDGVNIAARLEALADPGGICISKTAFDQIETKLPLGYEFLGEQDVKNIAKPVSAYRVLMDAEAAGKVIGEVRPKTKQLRGIAIGAVAVLIVVAGALAIWNFYFRPAFEPASEERMAFPLPEKPSIAVLPFDNMSGDPTQEYFSDGLAEELITALSKVPQLFVIARNSTFSYKGKSVKVNKIAEELGVTYVLEGSVRKAGDRVRITAQLIDALTGRHLWAERYDRDLKDVFALQDELTMKILTALQVRLTDGELARISAKGTQKLEAYLKVLQARGPFYTVTKEGFAQARRLCEEALAIDPDYAAAYVYLGSTHFMDVMLGSSKSPKESIKLAFEALTKAKTLDDSYAAAHSILGFIYVMKKQYDKGMAECERALTLEPNSATALIWMSLVLTLSGNHLEAVQPAERAVRLDPLGPPWRFRALGQAYSWVGRYEEAISAFNKSLQRAPNDIRTHISLTNAYSWAGRLAEARAQAQEVLRINPKYCLEQDRLILLFKNQADRDRHLEGLQKAGLPETPPLPRPDKPSIAVLPFVNMSGDPEQEYFSDGMTEEIITALSKTPKLFVIARNSTFTYKGKSVWIPTVGKELGVRYVLEGSVRKAGEIVRVTAQLIEAQTNNHVWAERYDRNLENIFDVQDEITLKIMTAMQVKLTEGEQAHMMGKGTTNLDAYLKWLQGREHLRRLNKEGNALARKMAKEAIVLDSEYPMPYMLLASTHVIDVWFKWSESARGSIKRAFVLSKKSIALDDSLPDAHGILSWCYLLRRQHENAIAEAEKAITLNPNMADAYKWLGEILFFSGRAEEAIQSFEKAIRLNPIPPSAYLHSLGMAYREAGRHDEAVTACQKAIRRQQNNIFAHLVLAATYSMMGREDQARAEASEVLRIEPKFSLEHLAKVRPHIDPENTARFVDSLRKAGLPE